MLVRPDPRGVVAGSKPTPSSATVNSSCPSVSGDGGMGAPAYLAVFCRASRQQKYTAASVCWSWRVMPSASRPPAGRPWRAGPAGQRVVLRRPTAAGRCRGPDRAGWRSPRQCRRRAGRGTPAARSACSRAAMVLSDSPRSSRRRPAPTRPPSWPWRPRSPPRAPQHRSADRPARPHPAAGPASRRNRPALGTRLSSSKLIDARVRSCEALIRQMPSRTGPMWR